MATSFNPSDILGDLQRNAEKMKEFTAQLEASFKENGMDGIQRFMDQKLGGWKNVKGLRLNDVCNCQDFLQPLR